MTPTSRRCPSRLVEQPRTSSATLPDRDLFYNSYIYEKLQFDYICYMYVIRVHICYTSYLYEKLPVADEN